MRILWKCIFIVNDSYREEEYFNALCAAIKTQERIEANDDRCNEMGMRSGFGFALFPITDAGPKDDSPDENNADDDGGKRDLSTATISM